jgi:hypothetical protein
VKHIKQNQVNPRGCKVKRCTSCLVDLIHPNNISTHNIKNSTYLCRTCNNKQKYQQEKNRRKNKSFGDTSHVADILKGVRKRAKKRKLEFSLRTKDIKKLLSSNCPILGIKYELNKTGLKWGNKEGQNNWATSLSVDRIDNNKGYIQGNIILVSSMANAIKNQATPDQIQKVATFYKKLYNEKGITYGE